MVNEKGLDGKIADCIGHYVRMSGGAELVQMLLQDNSLLKSKAAKDGLEAMALFLNYAGIYGLTDKLSFDLSLARGLDYYTGVIYEAVLLGKCSVSLHIRRRKHI